MTLPTTGITHIGNEKGRNAIRDTIAARILTPHGVTDGEYRDMPVDILLLKLVKQAGLVDVKTTGSAETGYRIHPIHVSDTHFDDASTIKKREYTRMINKLLNGARYKSGGYLKITHFNDMTRYGAKREQYIYNDQLHDVLTAIERKLDGKQIDLSSPFPAVTQTENVNLKEELINAFCRGTGIARDELPITSKVNLNELWTSTYYPSYNKAQKTIEANNDAQTILAEMHRMLKIEVDDAQLMTPRQIRSYQAQKAFMTSSLENRGIEPQKLIATFYALGAAAVNQCGKTPDDLIKYASLKDSTPFNRDFQYESTSSHMKGTTIPGECVKQLAEGLGVEQEELIEPNPIAVYHKLMVAIGRELLIATPNDRLKRQLETTIQDAYIEACNTGSRPVIESWNSAADQLGLPKVTKNASPYKLIETLHRDGRSNTLEDTMRIFTAIADQIYTENLNETSHYFKLVFSADCLLHRETVRASKPVIAKKTNFDNVQKTNYLNNGLSAFNTWSNTLHLLPQLMRVVAETAKERGIDIQQLEITSPLIPELTLAPSPENVTAALPAAIDAPPPPAPPEVTATLTEVLEAAPPMHVPLAFGAGVNYSHTSVKQLSGELIKALRQNKLSSTVGFPTQDSNGPDVVITLENKNNRMIAHLSVSESAVKRDEVLKAVQAVVAARNKAEGVA